MERSLLLIKREQQRQKSNQQQQLQLENFAVPKTGTGTTSKHRVWSPLESKMSCQATEST